jgi:diguanylate cyclase (GGDEF)-like protein/putative nucleotidyltransferase with HDIG domain
VVSNLSGAARVYVYSVCAVGAAALAAFAWLAPPAGPPWLLLASLAAAVVAAPFRIPLPVLGQVSIAFTFVFASLILLGATASSLTAAAAVLAASIMKRGARPPLHRTAFNVAALSLSSLVAGSLFRLAGGTSGALDISKEWLPILLATAAFFLVNTSLVAGAISFTDGTPFFGNWSANFVWTAPAYLGGAFLASTLCLGIQLFGYWALLLSLPLLYVLYFALQLYADKVQQESRHGKQMADLYLSVIEALALAIDAKDRTTQRHIRRVQTFAVELGKAMGLTQPELEALKAGSLLHDVGKLAVPEHILCKPGRLSREEFEKMRIHPRVGAEILEIVNFPFPLTEVVRSHHEKFDGTGYPDRLKGEQIPLTARILSVADCFDALTSDRPYRKPLTKEEALKYIQGESGVSYDPRVVEALVRNLDRMEGLAEEINKTRETSTAPDKRKINKEGGLDRHTNDLRDSVMEHISSAHRELYALYEIAQNVSTSLNLDEVLSFVSSKIASLIHYRCLIVYLYDKGRKVLKARYVNGRHTARLLEHEVKLGERMSGWAAVHRMPISGRAHHDPVEREGVRSDLEELLEGGEIEKLENAIVAPLLDGDMILGALALYDRPSQPYEEDHLRVISLIAKHVATAVKHAAQYTATQENVLTDPLTKLPNARYLFVSFEEEISRAMRQEVPLSVIELDVDNFKEVNDRHGHAAGDRILRALARLIREQLRGCDTCVRYAGDEFVVTVPGVGKQGIAKLQARIQEAIETHKFAVHGGKPLHITVGMGAASFPEDGRTFEALMAVADARMYEEKSARRNLRPDQEGYQRFAGRRDVPVN